MTYRDNKSLDAAYFWMVWREGSHDCSFQHWSRKSADEEAQRLARECPGKMFFVMKSATGFMCPVGAVSKAKMRQAVDDLDSEVPF